eukprot:gene5662-8963_t
MPVLSAANVQLQLRQLKQPNYPPTYLTTAKTDATDVTAAAITTTTQPLPPTTSYN